MSDIKRIDIKEFREQGYLQELNRNFLHPLGLALEIVIDEDGNESLGGVWDYRDDPEGMLYHDDIASSERFKENINRVRREFNEKGQYRFDELGFVVQPFNEKGLKE